MANKKESLAWAFVLQHATIINRIVRKQSFGSGISPEDMESEVFIRVAEKWKTYNEEASAPSTWIWWQARAVRKDLIRNRIRQLETETNLDAANHIGVRSNAESIVLVNQIKKLASHNEWNAAKAKADGYTGESLAEQCGCHQFSARRRIESLRNKINTEA